MVVTHCVVLSQSTVVFLSRTCIEHISTSKEKIFKKNLDGAAFTDDGFSIGLAYCLTLLGNFKLHQNII